MNINRTLKYIRFIETTHQRIAIGDALKKTERELLLGILTVILIATQSLMFGGSEHSRFALWRKLLLYIFWPLSVIGGTWSYIITKKLRIFCAEKNIESSEQLEETLRNTEQKDGGDS